MIEKKLRKLESLDPEQVAEILRVDAERVRELFRAGTLPGYKIGNYWRITKGDLETWIKNQKRDAKENATKGQGSPATSEHTTAEEIGQPRPSGTSHQ